MSQTQTTPPPVLSSGGASSVLLYAVIGAAIVVAVVLVGVFLVLRRRDLGGPAKPTSGRPSFATRVVTHSQGLSGSAIDAVHNRFSCPTSQR